MRMSVADYRAMLAGGQKGKALAPRRSKFGNTQSIASNGEKYDSNKERRHHEALELARQASVPRDKVVSIRRQVKFELIAKQEGERAVSYYADFVVEYGDGRTEVQDTKSAPTRKDPKYVIKRKLMLKEHGIKIREL